MGNLEAWDLRSRPIKVRKVWTLGTKGVGGGMIGEVEAARWRSRHWWQILSERMKRGRRGGITKIRESVARQY